MNILILLSVIELFSVSICVYMMSNEFPELLDAMVEKGYKLKFGNSSEVVDYIVQNQDNYSKTKLLIPIYNILYVKKQKKWQIENQINTFIDSNLLEAIPENSKEKYKNMNKYEKMGWVLNNSVLDELVFKTDYREEKQTYFPEKRSLKYPKLEGLYSLQEVYHLSDTYQYGVVLGRLNGIPTAIIGVYDSDIRFDFVKTDDKGEYIKFDLLDKEESKNLNFEVYPYTEPYDIEKFNKCLNDIYTARDYIALQAMDNSHSKDISANKTLVKK